MNNTTDTLEHALPGAQPSMEAQRRGWAMPRRETALAVGLFALVLALTMPFFNRPYYWDSLWLISGTEHIVANGFNPILPTGWEVDGHPVLFHEILGVAWVLLGKSLWVAHLITALFAYLTVYYTYRVGQLLYGMRAGIIAAVLLLTYPLFMAQSTVILLDLPSAAFAMIAITWLLRRKSMLYMLFASAMVLTKETSAWLIGPILVYLLVQNYHRKSRLELLVLLAIHALPLLVLATWVWYHWRATGVAAPANVRPLALLYAYLPPALFSRHGVLMSFAALVWRYLVVISLTGILTLLIIVRAFSLRPVMAAPWRQHPWRAIVEIVQAQPIWYAWDSPENVFLLGLPIVLLLAFMASVDGLQRDLLPQYALFFVLAARAIEGIFKHERLIAAATFGVAVIFVVSWTQPWFGVPLESPSNLRYLDFVEAHQAATAFIEQHYADKTILVGWPQYIELSVPIDGYVKRPQRVLAYADTLPHKARMIDLGARFFLDPQDVTLADFDLVYYSEHSYGVPNAKVLPEIIERFQLPLIAEFSKNSERVLIYGNPKRMAGLISISR